MGVVTPLDLDLREVADRAAAAAGREGDEATVDQLRPLPGGLSSLTFAANLVRRSAAVERIVIKVAPPGLEPVRNRDVLRQAFLLGALRGVPGLAVPDVLFIDPGAPPEVPPLFGMRFVAGDSFEPVNGHDHPLPAPDLLRARGLGAATMLAALHVVDPAACGLAHEPPVALAEEVARWGRALATVDHDLATGHERCAAALFASLPDPVAPAVVHGDWRLGNMLCTGAEIAAVIDWEIWSVADPRVDLSWFIAASVSDGNVFAVRDAPGLPGRRALLAAYETARGSAVEDFGWFEAFTEFKQAATMGLILKHNRRRPQPDPQVEAHAPQLPALLRHALALLASRPTPA